MRDFRSPLRLRARVERADLTTPGRCGAGGCSHARHAHEQVCRKGPEQREFGKMGKLSHGKMNGIIPSKLACRRHQAISWNQMLDDEIDENATQSA